MNSRAAEVAFQPSPAGRSISTTAHGQSRLPNARIAQRKGGSMESQAARMRFREAIYARYHAMAQSDAGPRSTAGSLLRGGIQSRPVPGRQLTRQGHKPLDGLRHAQARLTGSMLPSYVASPWWNCQRFPGPADAKRQKGNGPPRALSDPSLPLFHHSTTLSFIRPYCLDDTAHKATHSLFK